MYPALENPPPSLAKTRGGNPRVGIGLQLAPLRAAKLYGVGGLQPPASVKHPPPDPASNPQPDPAPAFGLFNPPVSALRQEGPLGRPPAGPPQRDGKLGRGVRMLGPGSGVCRQPLPKRLSCCQISVATGRGEAARTFLLDRFREHRRVGEGKSPHRCAEAAGEVSSSIAPRSTRGCLQCRRAAEGASPRREGHPAPGTLPRPAHVPSPRSRAGDAGGRGCSWPVPGVLEGCSQPARPPRPHHPALRGSGAGMPRHELQAAAPLRRRAAARRWRTVNRRNFYFVTKVKGINRG